MKPGTPERQIVEHLNDAWKKRERGADAWSDRTREEGTTSTAQAATGLRHSRCRRQAVRRTLLGAVEDRKRRRQHPLLPHRAKNKGMNLRRAPSSDHENQNITHMDRQTEPPDCKNGLTDSTLKKQIKPKVAGLRSKTKERNSTHGIKTQNFPLTSQRFTIDPRSSPPSLF
jgi:hypothetical protein